MTKFNELDFFGTPVTLHVEKDQTTIKSLPGALVSLILAILLAGYALNQGIDVFLRDYDVQNDFF